LPDTVRVAMDEITEIMQQRLLALAVDVGLQVLNALLEANVTAAPAGYRLRATGRAGSAEPRAMTGRSTPPPDRGEKLRVYLEVELPTGREHGAEAAVLPISPPQRCR
jgi:hypothetical protein